jgi:uncharacterized protein YjlB
MINNPYVNHEQRRNYRNLKFSLKKEDSPSILAEIANIPIPEKDPIFGDNGPLFEFWQ